MRYSLIETFNAHIIEPGRDITAPGLEAAHQVETLQQELTQINETFKKRGLSATFLLPATEYMSADAAYLELFRLESRASKPIVSAVRNTRTSERFVRRAISKAIAALMTDDEKADYREILTRHASQPNGAHYYF